MRACVRAYVRAWVQVCTLLKGKITDGMESFTLICRGIDLIFLHTKLTRTRLDSFLRQTERDSVEDVLSGPLGGLGEASGPTLKVLWQSFSTQDAQSSLRAANTKALSCVSTQNADMFS